MIRAYFLFIALSVCVLMLAAGCTRNAAPVSVTGTPPSESAANHETTGAASNASPDLVSRAAPQDAGGYAGDAACAVCHHSDFERQHASNHAHTLRLMEPASLGSLAPPSGPIPGSYYVIKSVGGAYYLDEDPGQGDATRLDYAFGAGRHGMTYVSTSRDDTPMMEMRASYFPVQRQWRATPGLEGMPPEGMGLNNNAQGSQRCFGCHVSAVPAPGVLPEKRLMGVGCEACHGPAGEHAAAMQRKGASLADLHIERLGTWDAARINTMCGRCHLTATPAEVKAAASNMASTKFQPNDLAMSRCFRESRNTLSCATCHDSHQNASHDRRAYEAICVACHSASGSDRKILPPAAGAPAALSLSARRTESADGAALTTHTVVKGKVCPVNARAGCVGCHMRPQKIMPDTMISFEAPDHNIRIYHTAKRTGR